MSVLVEALAVIVRRVTLDMSWPGGTDAYIAAALAAESPARLACADDELTAVSFLFANDCQAWIARLEHHGIVHLGDNRCVDIVCIDQQAGPANPCDWIEWRQHPDGFSYAWLAGTEPGDVVAPSTWRPRQSSRDAHTDVRDDNERMMQLATEDGLDYWLDLETGEQIVGLAQQPDASAPDRATSPPPRATMRHSCRWYSVRCNGSSGRPSPTTTNCSASESARSGSSSP
jgi:hypothetical protein